MPRDLASGGFQAPFRVKHERRATRSKSGQRGVPDYVHANGNLVLDGDGEEGGRVDLEVGEGGRDCALDVVRRALDDLSEGHVGVVHGIAAELDFKIAVEGGRCEAGFGQPEPDGDDGELCAAGDLNHVEVAIGVAGVEGFDRSVFFLELAIRDCDRSALRRTTSNDSACKSPAGKGSKFAKGFARLSSFGRISNSC
jgi:hypothetical protein